MQLEIVRCVRALVDGEERADFAFAIQDGLITSAGGFADVSAQVPGAYVRAFPEDRLVVPGFVNGHSHAYQILLRGWADDLTFERWRSEALYRVVPMLSPADVYAVFVAAFSEMLAAGITTVAEFFYLNGRGNAPAEAAIEAARDTGIRLVFARTWMDAAYAPEAFRESVETAASRTRALMERFPAANVCVAPHSLHAASPEMMRAASAFAQEHDCAMHVHVAEAAYERDQTLAAFDATPVRLLADLKALNSRTVAVHAIYIDDDEKRMIADAGSRVVHNPVTNQYLGDGICDVLGLQRLGVTMGLGTDADVKPSVIDEMRAASYLQKIARTDGSALGARAAFDLGTAQGARALGLRTGRLQPGFFADFLVLDAAAIDQWTPAVNGVVYRGEDRWVQASFVGGKRVYTGAPSQQALEARSAVRAIMSRILS